MSRQLHQMNQFQPQKSSNNYLTCDLNLSDMTFNDLFLEFDVNTNNFQSFDDLTNEINTHNLESVSDEVLSPNVYQPLIEQYENQQSNIELSSSPPNHDSIDHHESSSTSMSHHQNDQIISTRQSITNSSPLLPLSVQFPQLIKNPAPISVIFDQFQALTGTSKTTISTLLENSTIIGHNISLKIIHQINSNQPDSLMNNNKKSMTRNENNTRTYHNTIEKRSRSCINERIHQLKEIVAA